MIRESSCQWPVAGCQVTHYNERDRFRVPAEGGHALQNPQPTGRAGVASCRSPILRKAECFEGVRGVERGLQGRIPCGILNDCPGKQGELCLIGARARKGSALA